MTRMVDIIGHYKLTLFCLGQRNDWFDQYASAAFCHLGDAMLHFVFLLSSSAIRREVTLLCLMLTIGQREDFVLIHT